MKLSWTGVMELQKRRNPLKFCHHNKKGKGLRPCITIFIP